MPANIVKSVSDKCNKSTSEIEGIWDEAKKKAADQGHSEEYDYIVGIFKSMVGKECAKKMGWSLKESCLDILIEEYLCEGRKKKSGSYYENVRYPKEGETVWGLVGLGEKIIKGEIIRVNNIDNKGFSNYYVDIESKGKKYHLNIDLIFDHRPKKETQEDMYGTKEVWV